MNIPDLEPGQIWEWRLGHEQTAFPVILIEQLREPLSRDVITWRCFDLVDYNMDEWNFSESNMKNWRRLA